MSFSVTSSNRMDWPTFAMVPASIQDIEDAFTWKTPEDVSTHYPAEYFGLSIDLDVGPRTKSGSFKVLASVYTHTDPSRGPAFEFIGYLNQGDEVIHSIRKLFETYLQGRIIARGYAGGGIQCCGPGHGPVEQELHNQHRSDEPSGWHLIEEAALALMRRCYPCLLKSQNAAPDFNTLIPDPGADATRPNWSTTTTSPDGSVSIVWSSQRITY